MPMATSGAAAAASAVGWGAYKYNRANYLYDMGMAYTRYTTGYSMACEQAEMYREDIRDLTAITTSKQDLYHIVGVIFFVITFQLIMAGRLGVHGPVPSGWLMGMHWVCCGQAMLWLTLSTWLAMHASARATSGMAHMLTRSVRLPIPTPGQLDKARRYGNSYESSRVTDMLRVPLVTPAPKDQDYADPEMGGSSSSKGKASKASASGSAPHGDAALGGARRFPKWKAEDEDKELHGGADGGSPTVPVHFELYRSQQQEWWQHDIYAKISMLYFISHWFHGASYYIQSHCFTELRAMWPAWSCTFVFVAAHYGILKLEIYGEACKGFTKGFPVEKIAFITPLLTCFSMSLDYSIIEPSAGCKAVIYGVAWVAYAIHLAFAIRLYDLAVPTLNPEIKDTSAVPWWPSDWYVPAGFQHALFLIAPPKHVEPGQTCLQQEMKAAKKGGDLSVKKSIQVPPGTAGYPWKIFRGAAITMVAVWVLIIIGRIVEQLHGERMLMKQEGRVERWPSHMQPWMAPWTRKDELDGFNNAGSTGSDTGSRNEWCHTGGCDRRLQNANAHEQRIAAVAQRLSSVLTAVSQTLDHELEGASAAPANVAPLRQAKVEWPSQVAPTLLACSRSGEIAALRHDSAHGAKMSMPVEGVASQPAPFALEGLLEQQLGDLVGASWGDAGLMLTHTSGHITACLEGDNSWRCRQTGVQLPLGGSKLRWAVAARVPKTERLRAALVFEEDESITLFEHDAAVGAWEPTGEVRLPALPAGLHSFSMNADADELLLSAADGRVLRWPLAGTPNVAAAPRVSALTADLTWQGTCGVGNGQLLHLASSQGLKGAPAQLFVSARS
eukprot:TRINITY_DN26668_c0_g1_i1.p1 TRINITY_DN26668_c0_g1~~TRINITY_DN26668_c0_g1_i1.p1  ORF type:complete len:839 (-),score=221.38 TRINITY_DN26668_c0_g1_i1:81-2597(-)